MIHLHSGGRQTQTSPETAAALAAAAEAEVEGEIWRFPHSIYSVNRLNWDEVRGKTKAELLYGPPQSSLKILRTIRPILRDGVSCFAVVFTAADEKTRLVVSRRLLRLVVDLGAAFETIRQHEEANAGPTGVVILSAIWSQRERVEMMLLAALEQDQALQRMLLRSGMTNQRIRLDSSLLSDFVKRGGGIARHFRGPRTGRYRFSDFRLDEHVNFGVGVHLTLSFDDPEIMDFAMQRYSEFSASFEMRTEPYVLRLLEGHHDTVDCANTDMLWADQTITLAAGLNRHSTRAQASEYLEMVCGLDGVEAPISESLLSEGDAERGFTVPGRRND